VNFTSREVEEKGLDRQFLIFTKRGFMADVGDGVIGPIANPGASDVHTGLGQLFFDGARLSVGTVCLRPTPMPATIGPQAEKDLPSSRLAR